MEPDQGETAVNCQNCGHAWLYTGDKEPPSYVTCPSCYYKVPLPEDEEG